MRTISIIEKWQNGMLSTENLEHLYEYFLLRDIKWCIHGERRIPSKVEMLILLEDCINTVRDAPESISVEIGGLLVKRTDAKLDIYVHAGELDFND